MAYLLDLVGVAVFAVSGALTAGRKRLDLIGVLVLALVTAVGGGTTRDVLLDRHPLFWLADPSYLVIIAASALATMAFARWRRPPQSAMVVADALGLALFSVAGAEITERAGLPAVAGVLLGTVTGSAGGIIRDVLSGEVPLVLREGKLYATAAIVGTSAYFLLEAVGVPRGTAALSGMAVVVAIRFAAIWWELRLPVFHLDPTGELPVPRQRPAPPAEERQ